MSFDKNHDKFIYGLKKSKNIPKTEINLKPKSNRAQIHFFTNFKGKKTPNMSSLHQIKPFDINIDHFGALNRNQ
jgi:hypothetical protein